MRVSFTTAMPTDRSVGWWWIRLAVSGFLLQACVLGVEKIGSPIPVLSWVVLMPTFGLFMLLEPVLGDLFKLFHFIGASEKSHWPLIVVLMSACAVTSAVAGGILAAVIRAVAGSGCPRAVVVDASRPCVATATTSTSRRC